MPRDFYEDLRKVCRQAKHRTNNLLGPLSVATPNMLTLSSVNIFGADTDCGPFFAGFDAFVVACNGQCLISLIIFCQKPNNRFLTKMVQQIFDFSNDSLAL